MWGRRETDLIISAGCDQVLASSGGVYALPSTPDIYDYSKMTFFEFIGSFQIFSGKNKRSHIS